MAEKSLASAYKTQGSARRSMRKRQRFDDTLTGALDVGAELAFSAAEVKDSYDEEMEQFDIAKERLGAEEYQDIDMKTGEEWQGKSLFGFGEKTSYLNPWAGDRGLVVGDTLYDKSSIRAIAEHERYDTLDDAGKTTWRSNIKETLGSDVKETDWHKAKVKREEEAKYREEGLKKIEEAGALAGAEARKKKQEEIDLRNKDIESSIISAQSGLGSGVTGALDDEMKKKLKLEEDAQIQSIVDARVNPWRKIHKDLESRGFFDPRSIKSEEDSVLWENMMNDIGRYMKDNESSENKILASQP